MSDKKEKDPQWMQNLWRPAMGWMYMLICLLDMAVFPVAWSLLQAMMHVPITQWNPLTLQGAGLFHIAMGAVLGISAFGRTQEKLAGTAANPTATSTTTTTNNNSTGVPASGGFGGMNNGSTGGFGGSSTFGAPSTGGFGSSSGGFGSPAPTAGFSGSGFGGTPSPAPTGFGGFGSSATAAPQPISTTASGKKIVPVDDQPLQ